MRIRDQAAEVNRLNLQPEHRLQETQAVRHQALHLQEQVLLKEGLHLHRGGTTSSTDQTSADTRLSELQINCGQLVPEFSPDQYNYTVYVEYDGEPIDCGTSAVGIDSSVSIRAEGPTEITGEDAQKRVIAEAADGSYSEYVIDLHVVKDNELLIGNAQYVISEPKI